MVVEHLRCHVSSRQTPIAFEPIATVELEHDGHVRVQLPSESKLSPEDLAKQHVGWH